MLSYVQMIMAVAIQLLYTPFMLRVLGDNEYGLMQTATSTVSMLSVLTLGFNSGYIRYYARYKQTRNTEAIYKLNGLFLILFCILGSIVLACGLFLANHLEFVFDEGLTKQEYITGKILLIITTVNLALSFPRSVFSNIISANEKYVFLKGVAIIESVGGPLVNVAVLMMGFRSVAVTVGIFCTGLVVFLLYIGYTFAVLNQRFVFYGFERGILASLFRFTGFIMINIIVDQVNNQVDKVLLARYCGTAVVALYAVGISFSNYYTQFSTAVSGIFTPRVHQMVLSTQLDSSEQRTALTGFFTKVGRIQFLLLSLISSGFVFFGQAFLELWIGSGYEVSYYVALVCMLPGTIPLIQNVGIEIQRAENRHHYRSIIYGIIAVFNIVVSIYLCQIWGAVGAAIGTGAACVLGHGIIMNTVYHKKINIDMRYFWRNIIRQLCGMIPAFIVGYLMMQFAPTASWISMGCVIVLYIIVYFCTVWCLSMNAEEKAIIRTLLKKVKRRGAAK